MKILLRLCFVRIVGVERWRFERGTHLTSTEVLNSPSSLINPPFSSLLSPPSPLSRQRKGFFFLPADYQIEYMHMYVDFYLLFLVLLHSELSGLSVCQFVRFSATVSLGIL